MIFKATKQLKPYLASSWLKLMTRWQVLKRGENAGAWTIGVTKTGNLVGLGEKDLKSTSSA